MRVVFDSLEEALASREGLHGPLWIVDSPGGRRNFVFAPDWDDAIDEVFLFYGGKVIQIKNPEMVAGVACG